MSGVNDIIWKDIPGYEGWYQASRCGKIKRMPVLDGSTQNPRMFKEKILDVRSYTGYYVLVGLRKGGKSRTHPVHRLIAMTFIENPENKPFVNHKDLDKTNNRADNLEWCTHQENIQHWVDTLRKRQEAFKEGVTVEVKATKHRATVIRREAQMVFVEPAEMCNKGGDYYYEQLQII